MKEFHMLAPVEWIYIGLVGKITLQYGCTMILVCKLLSTWGGAAVKVNQFGKKVYLGRSTAPGHLKDYQIGRSKQHVL